MNKKLKILALLVAIVAFIFCQVNTTLCYIVTETTSIANTFISGISKPEDIIIDIHIDVFVKNIGDSNISHEGFEIVLENIETGEKITVVSNQQGEAIFPLPFNEEDIGKEYTYKLYQIDGGIENLIYDTTIYEIEIDIVLDENNRIVAITKLNGDTVDKVVAIFENTLRLSPSPAPPTKGDTAAIPMIMMFISGCALIRIAIADKRKFRIKKN